MIQIKSEIQSTKSQTNENDSISKHRKLFCVIRISCFEFVSDFEFVFSCFTRETGMKYDLEERTELFAKRTRDFVRTVPKDHANVEYGRQLIRSASSIGANDLEANEALSKKDFLMRIKISRKEAKESRYWLRLITPGENQVREQVCLVQESTELLMILSAILRKSQNGQR